MTPTERSSLRAALVISLAMYTVLFFVLALVPAGRKAEHQDRTGSPERPLTVNLIAGSQDSTDAQSFAAAANLPSPRSTNRSPHEVQPVGASGSDTSSIPSRPTKIPRTAHNGNRQSEAPGSPPVYAQPAPTVGPIDSETAPSAAAVAAQRGKNALGSGRNVPNYSQSGLQKQGRGSSSDGSATAGGSQTIAAILAGIRDRIVQNRVYPTAAERRGIQGRVTVAATVGADGRLLHSQVIDSSGSKILDTAGIELLRRVFPVENPLGRGFTVEIPITYRLRNAG